jgi:hypothetical protein
VYVPPGPPPLADAVIVVVVAFAESVCYIVEIDGYIAFIIPKNDIYFI